MTAQQKKTEVVVARLWDFHADGSSQLVHSIALQHPPTDRLTMHEVIGPRLQELDFDLPDFPRADAAPVSLWKLRVWAEIDYIPLSEWTVLFRLKPDESNMVPRPGGDPMVIARYVDYERVKAF